MSISSKTIAIGALALVFTACGKNENKPAAYGNNPPYAENEPVRQPSQPQTTEGNQNMQSERELTAGNDMVLSELVDARCTREERCNNIGSGQKYASKPDCMTKVREDWRDDLQSRACSNGVNQSQLSDCLDKIRNDSCSNVVESLSRWANCRQSEICKD